MQKCCPNCYGDDLIRVSTFHDVLSAMVYRWVCRACGLQFKEAISLKLLAPVEPPRLETWELDAVGVECNG